jgi:hypothetical protein
MKHTTIRLTFFLLLAVLVPISIVRSQVKEDQFTDEEKKAEVPALNAFHTVIYKLWHTAWPKKDYDMLGSLLPEIQRRTDSVANAQLPGILRDKKPVWTEGVKKLQEIVGEYKSAVETKQNQKLLDAAERLHMQYERLVRIIRPALKELDEFHQVLYSVYHYYLPENNMEKVKASIPEFQQKMTALNNVTLPERLKKKQESFGAFRAKLAKSVNELAAAAKTNDARNIKAAVEKLHTQYEMLEKAFE